jgi:adenylate cyclase
MKDVDATIAWLIGGASSAPTPAALLEELAGRLLAAGLPLDRLAIFASVLHPDVANRSFIWRPGAARRNRRKGI